MKGDAPSVRVGDGGLRVDGPIVRATVLGAGVMGAQIAALLANAGIEVDLLDLSADGDPAGRARAGLDRLGQLRPAALYLPEVASRIHPGSLEQAGAAVARADWVIEAVVEDLAVKAELYGRVAPHLRPGAVLSSNTSGLSIARLSAAVGPAAARRFLGVHFFNPPRQMRLVEVIPGPDTDAAVVEAMTRFLRDVLGKGAVPCRDTPNFVANRLGVFAVLDVLHRMEGTGLSVEQVDAVTGPLLGRPRSATLRLCDLIGLDTLLHVAHTAHAGLPHDPARATFAAPPRVEGLVAAGRLGAKSGSGFYRKTPAGLEALDLGADPGADGYRPLVDSGVELPTRGLLAARLAAVWAATDPAGTFARGHLTATLAYCATCALEVAAGLEEVDRALCWGFNWEAGPFQIVDLLGAEVVRDAVDAAGLPVPDLLRDLAGGQGRVYVDGGARVWAAGDHRRVRPAGPPTDAALLAGAEVLRDGEGARLLYLGDGTAAIELRGKLNVLSPAGLAQAKAAIEAEAFEAIVLTGAGAQFSAGADLGYVLGLVAAQDWAGLEAYVRLFQELTTGLRYASVPVVVAARGLALGGGCEMCLSSAGRVVAGELRAGLVETRVGVVPAAGGCKEMVRRFGADVDAFVPGLLQGRMSDNALEARAWGYLGPEDVVRLDDERLIPSAVALARSLVAAGWTPPAPAPLPVAGPQACQRLQQGLAEAAAQGRITAHDAEVGRALAHVVCGGGEAGPLDEDHLLDLEREAFLHLCGTAATKARIEHMLRTGTPLRN